MIEHNVTTYIRTKQFWQNRLRDVQPTRPVFIRYDEIRPFTRNPERELEQLVQSGELIRTVQQNFYKNVYYSAAKKGGINPLLLQPNVSKPLDEVTSQMRNYLKMVSLPPDTPRTPYFDVFLMFKDYTHLFFTVDSFSGRVHTPVTSFHTIYRPQILLDNEKTTSLDVVTMQPVLLAKILKNEIGENQFSRWINSGEDIYLLMQQKAKLSDRLQAKKRFFEILFSRPNDCLIQLFGDANWIKWINDFKSKPFTQNPHTLEKNHSNLAYLLQTTEVNLMREVWENLLKSNIVFLSVHDEIIVKESDYLKAREIFSIVLNENLEYFKLTENKSLTPQNKNYESGIITQRINRIRAHINEKESTIERIRAETQTMEHTFREVAQRCKIEWFRPEWIKSNYCGISEFIYWTE
jgi:hypothetical protein